MEHSQPAAGGRRYRVGGGEVAWRSVGDEIVVLDLTNSVYFGLDRSGALLWRRLVSGATVDELVTELAGSAPAQVSRARITDDVATFLAELHREGLLHSSTGR